MDSIPDSEKDSQYYRDVIDLCQHVKYFADDLAQGKIIDQQEFTYSLDLLERVLKIRYDEAKDGPLSLWCWRVMEDFLRLYEKKSTKDVGMVIYYMKEQARKFPRWYYDFYVEVPYEYTTVRLPIGYDSILRITYGNYMYPKVEFSGHFYPNFKMLEKIALDDYGIGLLGYAYDKNEIDALRKEWRENEESRQTDGARKVLFLVRKPDHWSSLHTLWQAACDDENAEVTVIAVPYYYRDERGNINPDGMICENEGYPDEVQLTSYDAYDIAAERPDVVIFQDPYDEYHDSYMVHPDFFVKKLRAYIGKLVFIPPFMLEEIIPANKRSRITLGFYLKNVGEVLADRIYAQSEGMKEVYTELLSDMTDEIDWDERVRGVGVPMMDSEDGRIRPTDEHRYVLLYHINVSVLYEHGDKVLDRGRQLLKMIEERGADFSICYIEDPNIRKVLPERKPKLWERYEHFIQELSEHPQVNTYEPEEIKAEVGTDTPKAVAARCDGYFGDGSVYMNAVRELKKPVLWQTPWRKLDRPGSESGTWDPARKVMTEGDWDVKHFLDEMVRITDEGRTQLDTDPGESYGSIVWKDICTEGAGRVSGREGEALLDEVRDGFLVPSMMKKQWAINLDDTDRLTEVCREHGIGVYAGWGTLLGAIRHGGFIPWDDDVDMEMLRNDYEDLIPIVGKEERISYRRLYNRGKHEYRSSMDGEKCTDL